MNQLLKLEDLGQFLLSTLLFSQLDYEWWVYPAFLLLPDLSMMGYAANPKTGEWLENQHKIWNTPFKPIGIMYYSH